ncbi:MAG TPA: hypothetical protein VMW08_00990 [Acidimicrobiales bacterium]|nr:hypothetical protein [Acidimicrobiales bacterium]
MSAAEIIARITTGIFVHFTTLEDAEAIASTKVLGLSRTIEDACYAVAAGGIAVEGVQYGGGAGVIGAAGRQVAVIFTAAEAPDTIFPEEVIWHRATPLALAEAEVVTAAEAIALLDGSLNIPDNGAFGLAA